MSTEEKYKELKKKYVALKDAVKHLHDDYAKISSELVSKKAECSSLEEQHSNLQKAYDNLTDEVSYIKTLKQSKLSGSTWENPITLIKNRVQSSSNPENGDISILYDELVSMKSKLESTTNEKEELQKQYQELKNENERDKFEYDSGISEMTRRILALEGILKDLQGNLDTSERRASSYEEEISSLKATLESRNSTVEKLEEAIEGDRKSQVSYVSLLEIRLRHKLSFDLRRLSVINLYNIYQQQARYDWPIIRRGVERFHDRLMRSVHRLFQAWHSAFQFSQESQIVTDTLLQDGLQLGNHSNNPVDSYPSQEVSTESNKSLIASFVDISPSTPTGNIKSDDINYSGTKHLLGMLEHHRKKSLWLLSELMRGTQDFMEKGSQYTVIKEIIDTFREFASHQRLYFCIEEYLYPSEQATPTPKGPRRSDPGNRLLISCFKRISHALSKLYTFHFCSYMHLEELSLKEQEAMIRALGNEIPGSHSQANVTRSSVNDRNAYDLCLDTRRDADASTFVEKDHHYIDSLMEKGVTDNCLLFFSRRYMTAIREVLDVIHKLKSAISYRLCCPKMIGRQFLPLSGGSQQLLSFSESISNLEEDLSLITEKVIYALLRCPISSPRDQRASVAALSSDVPYTAIDEVHGDTSHPALLHMSMANSEIKNMKTRINLDNIEGRLVMAKENQLKVQSCNKQLRILNEELMVAKTRCKSLEEELRTLKSLGNHDQRFASEVEKLILRYRRHDQESLGKVSGDHYGRADMINELQRLQEGSVNSIRKLSDYVKHLIKTVNVLEDSNRLLKQAVAEHVEQHKANQDKEMSMRLNYGEQIALMSEHISELNNSIVHAEYRLAEFANARIMCPSCKTQAVLGSIAGSKSAGTCSSCSRRLIDFRS